MQASYKKQDGIAKSLLKGFLLPISWYNAKAPFTCSDCGYVNHATYKYCTNCGYPAKPNAEQVAVYKFARYKRKRLIKDCYSTVAQARASLYIMSAISLLGIGYFLSGHKMHSPRAWVLLIASGLYFALARWSVSRPFPALLISFLMLISFMAVNAWAGYRKVFTSLVGFNLMAFQFIFFYFLFKGVKAAYQADILEEEFKR